MKTTVNVMLIMSGIVGLGAGLLLSGMAGLFRSSSSGVGEFWIGAGAFLFAGGITFCRFLFKLTETQEKKS